MQKFDDQSRFPVGLPEYLTDGEDGSQLLLDVLELKTSVQRRTISAVLRPYMKKNKIDWHNSSSSEVICKIYAFPDIRQKMYKGIKYSIGKKRSTTKYVPSFEYLVLAYYSDKTPNIEMNNDFLISEFEAYSNLSNFDAGDKKCLMAWEEVKSDLLDWETYGKSQEIPIANAVFSLSSLLNNPKFIVDQIKLFPCLSEYLSNFVCSHPDSQVDVNVKWETIFNDIINCCTMAVKNSPNKRDIDLMKTFVSSLVALKDDIADEVDIQERFNSLLIDFESKLRNLASQELKSWLDDWAVNQLKARWELELDKAKDFIEITNDLQRKIDSIASLSEAYSDQLNLISQLQNERDGISATKPQNRIESIRFNEQIREIDLKKEESEKSLFTALLTNLSPYSLEFNYNNDYVVELENSRGCSDFDGDIDDVPKTGSEEDGDENNDDFPEDGLEDETDEASESISDPIKGADGESGSTEFSGVETEDSSGGQDETETDEDINDVTQNEVLVGGISTEVIVPEGSDLELYEASAETKSDPIELAESASLGQNQPAEETPAIEDNEITSQEIIIDCPERESIASPLIRLINSKRVGLAYNYSKYYGLTHPDEQTFVDSEILRALALSPYIACCDGEISKYLKNVYLNIGPSVSAEAKRIPLYKKLFMVSALLRPSLLSPVTTAGTILRSLRVPELTLFDKYCQSISDFSEHHLPLDIASLNRVKNSAAWQNEVTALRAEAQDWLSQAPNFSMVFGPAKKVWIKWFEKNELISSMMAPILAQDESKLEFAKQLYATYSNDAEIDNEVERTDKKIRNIRRSGDSIEARALHKLRESIGFVLRLLKRWINLIESKPGQKTNFKLSIAEDVRTKIIAIQDNVLSELKDYRANHADPLFQSAVTSCIDAVNDIKEMFQPDNLFVEKEHEVRHILNAELLKIGSLHLSHDWEPDTDNHDKIFQELDTIVDNVDVSWAEAYQKHASAKNHEMTRYLLEWLRAFNYVNGELEALENKRKDDFSECLFELERYLQNTRQKVEEAFAYGLIRDFERSEFVAEIEEISTRLQHIENFSIENDKLNKTNMNIEQKRKQQVEEVQKEMKKREITPDHSAYNRIQSLLEAGDVLTANEYIEMACNGQDLPVIETPIDHFRSFFPEKAAFLEKYLTTIGNPSSVVRKIKDRNFPEIDMRIVPGAQADQAGDMLEMWYRIKRDGKAQNNLSLFVSLFNLLGFSSPKFVPGALKTRHSWITCVTDNIHDKTVCPISTFGSNAEGKYRILCCWDRPSEEELSSWVGDTTHGSPVIVLHFGCMTEQRRRDLARLCRREIKTFILIDDILMVYLCSVRGMRLPVMFGCSLPFTYMEPYVTTGGLVPAEMFFGRQRARASLIADSESSASVIYGGRQLGKTALLKEVERTFEAIGKDNKALYIDLKGEDIGYGSPIDDIWAVIVRRLKSVGILPTNQNVNIEGRKLSDLIESWLKGNPGGRVVLLLDEADRFLESDGKEEFKRTALLKNLMEKTKRKFKVIFSGLHNVQRTARQNDPIAHLGEPICIGPLLDHGEWREARALIEVPFANMGYHFDVQDGKQDLVTRILSQTNYYPSLIQLYCKQLLKHITSEFAKGSQKKTSLPFKITTQHVDDAYRDQDLQKAIRHRFLLTLRLDPRYEVIAYSIAFGFLGNGKNMTEGYPLSWIRSQSLYWWEEGFRNCYDLESFRVLVDEMVGLGVLRHIKNDFYTFRSLNVISLMGNQDEIADALEMKRELPPEYEPAIFRKTKKMSSQLICNPLTSHEESRLKSYENRVYVIVGSKISGVDYLKDFLSETFEGYFSALDIACDNNSFNKQLESITQRKKDGTSIYLVNHTCPWSDHWIESASDKIRKLKSKDSCAKVVFVADPHQLLYILNNDQMLNGEEYDEEVSFIYLKPLHKTMVNHWLQESGLGPYDNQVDEIEQVTGNWPELIYEFQKNLRSPHLWRNDLKSIEDGITDRGKTSRYLNQFGIDTPDAIETLYTLALLETMDEKTYPSTLDIQSQVEGIPDERVEKIMQWASMLAYATPAGRDGWKMNPIVKRLVVAHKEN